MSIGAMSNTKASPIGGNVNDRRNTGLEGGYEVMVKVTVLSLSGFVAKKHVSMKRMKRRKHPSPTSNTTSLVVSFYQTYASDKQDKQHQTLTHVPSIPESLDASSSKYKPTLRTIVHWPSTHHDREDDNDASQILSTMRFSRRIQLEELLGTQDRFIPLTCPIYISILRNGCLRELGKASIIITGEEEGSSSMMVPISSTIKKVASHRKSSTPMVRIKGDDLKFGLKKDAMLRVLVSVSRSTKDQSIPSALTLDDSAAAPPSESETETEVAIDAESSSISNQARARQLKLDSSTNMSDSLCREQIDVQENMDHAHVVPQDYEAAETALDLAEFLAEEGCDVESPTQADVCSKMNADINNGLSLCMLGAVLGSPTLSCARKNGIRSTTRDAKFWDLEDSDSVDGDKIPNIRVDIGTNLKADDPSLKGSALNDTFSTDESDSYASDEEFFDFEDVYGNSHEYHSPLDRSSIKSAVDSALAWSALILLLNLPAPSLVSQLEHSSERELNDTLSTIQEEDASHFDDSIDGIPSLAGTDESFYRTPTRKRREYKFQDSLDGNDLFPQIEALANQIEKCPHCNLFCCKSCPRFPLVAE